MCLQTEKKEINMIRDLTRRTSTQAEQTMASEEWAEWAVWIQTISSKCSWEAVEWVAWEEWADVVEEVAVVVNKDLHSVLVES